MKLFLLYTLIFFCSSAWSAEEQVEIHASLCPSSQEELLIQLGREPVPTKSRDIWYLDYKNLSLNDSGKILRIRKDHGKDKVSVTVKLRGQIEQDFLKPDIDCEKDWYGFEVVSSCSLDSSLQSYEWDLAFEGQLPLTSLFSTSQLHFLTNDGGQVNFKELKIFGLIKAQIWKFDDKTLEVWSMESHGKHLEIYEISTRASLKEAKEVERRLYQDLNSLGVRPCTNHISKTRTVLEFLSQEL